MINNNDKISIIIPIYNAQKYLVRLLDSVVNQTYSNLEIICVNDGSTDESEKICLEYAKVDARIKHIYKENGGISVARNTGLSISTGKYIGFVDSDDWIEPTMYEKLYEAIVREGVGISVVNFYRDNELESEKMENRTNIPKGAISYKDTLSYFLDRDNYMGYCGYIWNKLFDKTVMDRENISFNESIKFGEDILFFGEYIAAVSDKNRVSVYVNESLYHYRQHIQSIKNTKNILLRAEIIGSYEYVAEMIKKRGLNDILFLANAFICYHASEVLKMALLDKKMNREIIEKYADVVKEFLSDYKKTNSETIDNVYKIEKMLEEIL